MVELLSMALGSHIKLYYPHSYWRWVQQESQYGLYSHYMAVSENGIPPKIAFWIGKMSFIHRNWGYTLFSLVSLFSLFSLFSPAMFRPTHTKPWNTSSKYLWNTFTGRKYQIFLLYSHDILMAKNPSRTASWSSSVATKVIARPFLAAISMDVWQLKPAENCRFSPTMNGDGFCGKNVEAKRHGFKGKHIGSAKKGIQGTKLEILTSWGGLPAKTGEWLVFSTPLETLVHLGTWDGQNPASIGIQIWGSFHCLETWPREITTNLWLYSTCSRKNPFGYPLSGRLWHKQSFPPSQLTYQCGKLTIYRWFTY